MSAPAFVLEGLTAYVLRMDGHQLADVLKLVAAQLDARDLPGYRRVWDVAFEVHAFTAHANIAAGVARYVDPLPPL